MTRTNVRAAVQRRGFEKGLGAIYKHPTYIINSLRLMLYISAEQG